MLRTLAAAAAMTLAATSASAFVLSPANNLVDGQTYDVFGGPYFFNVSFLDTRDGPGTFSFNFTNSGPVEAIVSAVGAVTQLGINYAGGVTMSFSGGPSLAVGPGTTDGGELTLRLASGGNTTLTVAYGNSVFAPRRTRGRATIDISVDAAPVPLPAASGLLLVAVGGLAAVRRRGA